ncbi:hypothetical protein CSOJ01_13944 [Colletotrichum sojae]|uniref:Uncharacterized protein n=1 Tax=Colletotrichum sojae TaxID=2175907 RepID=A0A8H6MJX8_9PEZI|nr:hypothetical protein CSOJ01_13944 [Colletotrichum sojae]
MRQTESNIVFSQQSTTVCIAHIATFAALAIGASAAAVTKEEASRVLQDPVGNVDLQLQVTREAILAAMARGESLVGTISKKDDALDAYEKAPAEDKLLLSVNVKDAKVIRYDQIQTRDQIESREPVEWFDFKI